MGGCQSKKHNKDHRNKLKEDPNPNLKLKKPVKEYTSNGENKTPEDKIVSIQQQRESKDS
jgi:hypothetical protein